MNEGTIVVVRSVLIEHLGDENVHQLEGGRFCIHPDAMQTVAVVATCEAYNRGAARDESKVQLCLESSINAFSIRPDIVLHVGDVTTEDFGAMLDEHLASAPPEVRCQPMSIHTEDDVRRLGRQGLRIVAAFVIAVILTVGMVAGQPAITICSSVAAATLVLYVWMEYPSYRENVHRLHPFEFGSSDNRDEDDDE